MARTKPADERCDDLLNAAETAFVDNGVAATTVTEITTRAGVAKGTFYLYFDSKADLVAAVQRRYGERFIDRISDAIASAGDDWGAKLDAIVVAGLADESESRRLHDVLFADRPPTSGAGESAGDAQADVILAVVRDVLDAGVAAGAFRIADTTTTAMLLLNTLHGLYHRFWTEVTAPDAAILGAAARTLFRRAAGLPDPEF